MRPALTYRPASILFVLTAGLGLAACAAETARERADAPVTPAPRTAADDALQPEAIPAPSCILEGCCEGHGEVAHVQPDRVIMCTDGQPSLICDCH